MNTYRLTYNCKHTLMPKMTGLTETQDAIDPKRAMDVVRARLYQLGYDDILFTKVEIVLVWQEIPMMQALVLE